MAHRRRTSACSLAIAGRRRSRRLDQQRGSVVLPRLHSSDQRHQGLDPDAHAPRCGQRRLCDKLLSYRCPNTRLQQDHLTSAHGSSLHPRGLLRLWQRSPRRQDRRTIPPYHAASARWNCSIRLSGCDHLSRSSICGHDVDGPRSLHVVW